MNKRKFVILITGLILRFNFFTYSSHFIHLKPYSKLLGQIVAGCVVIANGLLLGPSAFPILGIFLTLFWIVGVTNAFNLLDNMSALGQFDVVYCRNVLIYFDQETKAKVLNAIADILAPDGALFLGGAETVLGISDRFQLTDGKRGLYGLTKTSANMVA